MRNRARAAPERQRRSRLDELWPRTVPVRCLGGGPGTIAQSIAACRVGGHISLIGVLTGISGEVPTAALFAKNLTVSGITVGSRQHQLDMIAAIETSGIKPVLDQDFPLDQIADAFMHQASGAHFGKITISL